MALSLAVRRGAAKRIAYMEVSIMSPDEIRGQSVGVITSSMQGRLPMAPPSLDAAPIADAIFDEHGPVQRLTGLHDPLMGTTSNDIMCSTCGHGLRDCPGHPGHIEFPVPLYNPFMTNMVFMLLHLFCYACSRLLPEESSRVVRRLRDGGTVHYDERLKAAKDGVARVRTAPCRHCGLPHQPVYTMTNMVTIMTTWRPGAFDDPALRDALDVPFSAALARAILKAVPDDDYRAIGWPLEQSHPSWMIVENMIVPPPIMRPDVQMAQGSRKKGQDELTTALQEILKALEKLFKELDDLRRKGLPLPRGFGTIVDHVRWLLATQPDGETMRAVRARLDELAGVEEGECGADGAAADEDEDDGVEEVGGAPVHSKRRRLLSPASAERFLEERSALLLERRARQNAEEEARLRSSGEIGRTRSGNQSVQRRVRRGGSVAAAAAVGSAEWHRAAAERLCRLVAELQLHFAMYVRDDMRDPRGSLATSSFVPGSTSRGSIGMRLKGKQGRFRGNVSGKRTDFSARTVIVPDPTVAVDEIILPKCVLTTLTVADVVTPRNIDELSKCVARGPGALGGASIVVRADGTAVHLRAGSGAAIQLRPGDVVHRALRDGDPVIFNRQPSLHRPSMMAHRVRATNAGLATNQHATAFNANATPPYNADFDGDEMNVHVPQGPLERAEALELMAVGRNLISVRTCAPVYGCVQDSLIAMYQLTQRGVFFTRAEFMQLAMAVYGAWAPPRGAHERRPFRLPAPAVLRPEPRWTGKQVFSMLLPRGIYLRREIGGGAKRGDGGALDASIAAPDDSVLIVHNGDLLSGAITKRAIGVRQGVLLQAVASVHGEPRAARLVTDISRLTFEFQRWTGFRIGISDCIAPADMRDEFARLVEVAIDAVRRAEAAGDLGPAEREVHAISVLNAVLREIADVAAEEPRLADNAFRVLTACGAKGDRINWVLVALGVCQQLTNGERLRSPDSLRVMLHQDPRGDADPRNRGFIVSSYSDGLRPSEFLAASKPSRASLADPSSRTRDSGQFQRSVSTRQHSMVVAADGTVRTALGHVVQFRYGGDGFDSCRLETVALPLLLASDAALRAHMLDGLGDAGALPPGARKTLDTLVGWAREARDELRAQRLAALTGLAECCANLPAGLELAIDAALAEGRAYEGEARARVQDVAVALRDLFRSVARSHRGALPGAALRFYLFVKLTPGRVVAARLARERMAALAARLQHLVERADVAPGESVGVIAAQSIGEPATQMTLSSFHFAGVGDKVSLGLSRLGEILRATVDIRTPVTTIYLRAPYCDSEEGAMRAAARICGVTLASVCTVMRAALFEPLESPQPDGARPFERAAFLVQSVAHADAAAALLETAHVAEFVLAAAALRRAGLRLLDVVEKLSAAHPRALVLWDDRDPAAPRVIVRPRGAPQPDVAIAKRAMEIGKQTLLAGVQGVGAVSPAQVEELRVAADGSVARAQTWVLQAEGSALRNALALAHIVDVRRTHTNDIHRVRELFGIEAAFNVAFHQLYLVMTFEGSFINARHMALTIDALMYRGAYQTITRSSLEPDQYSPLERATFEQPLQTIASCAVSHVGDPIADVTSAIFFGQEAPIGTGRVRVLDDPRYGHFSANAAALDATRPAIVARGVASSALVPAVGPPRMAVTQRTHAAIDELVRALAPAAERAEAETRTRAFGAAPDEYDPSAPEMMDVDEYDPLRPADIGGAAAVYEFSTTLQPVADTPHDTGYVPSSPPRIV